MKVNSSVISEVDYDKDTSVLTVIFNSGASYDYNGVPEDVYEDLINAPSVGSYFVRNIRNNY